MRFTVWFGLPSNTGPGIRSSRSSCAVVPPRGQPSCRRGDRLLFRGLDFELAAGQIVWLRGPNGSGKIQPAAPAGRPVDASPRGHHLGAGTPLRGWRRPVPLCSTSPMPTALEGRSPVLESLQFLARLPSPWRRRGSAAPGAAARRPVQPPPNAAVRSCSQGSGARRAGASAPGCAAPVWILDEPFTMRSMRAARPCSTPPVGARRRGGGRCRTSHIDLTLADPRPRCCNRCLPRAMSSVFATIVARDLRLATRRRVEALPRSPFLVAVSLFRSASASEPQMLRQIAPAWSGCALLAAMLADAAVSGGADHADGSLEQMLLSGDSLWMIAGQGAGALVVTGAPLVLARRCSACCSTCRPRPT